MDGLLSVFAKKSGLDYKVRAEIGTFKTEVSMLVARLGLLCK